MSELKPCPFCGGDATLRYEPSPGVYYVHCDTCGSETGNTGLYRKEDKAIEAWNTRAVEVCEVVGFADAEPLPIIPERTCRAESHDCGDGVTGLYCSECGNYIDENDNYCPTCGAKVVK